MINWISVTIGALTMLTGAVASLRLPVEDRYEGDPGGFRARRLSQQVLGWGLFMVGSTLLLWSLGVGS